MSTNPLPGNGTNTVHAPAHLSYSRLNRYQTCPEQYRLYYVEGWRPKIPSASLLFGQAIHQALCGYFQKREDPVGCFTQNWNECHKAPLHFSAREDWDKLLERGQTLLKKVLADEVPRLSKVIAAELPFELRVTTLGVPLVGVIDLLAEIDGRLTVIDFKTSGSSYDDHEVILSDQLTTYHLAQPEARQSALCVFVKTKEPKIEWYFAERTGEQLTQFLEKAELLSHDIIASRFYRRPGQWCSYCDYLSLCITDRQRSEETLVRFA